MENKLEFLNKYRMLILIPLVIIMFFRTCNTSRDIEKNHISDIKRDSAIVADIEAVSNKILSDTAVQKVFSLEMWNFLELEELADKKGISITQLKHMRKEE